MKLIVKSIAVKVMIAGMATIALVGTAVMSLLSWSLTSYPCEKETQ
jgi:hypothetical protein